MRVWAAVFFSIASRPVSLVLWALITVTTHSFAQGNLDFTTVIGSSSQSQTIYLQKRLMQPGPDAQNPAVRHRVEQELKKFDQDPDISAGLRTPSIFSFQASYALSRLTQYVADTEATRANLGHNFNLGLAFDLHPQWNVSLGGAADVQPVEKYKNGGLSVHLTYSHGLRDLGAWFKYVFSPKIERTDLKPYQYPARRRAWHTRGFVPVEDPFARNQVLSEVLSYPLLSVRFSGYLNKMIKDPTANLFDGTTTSQSLLAADLGQLSLNQRGYGLGTFISWSENFTMGTSVTQYLYSTGPADAVTALSGSALAYDTATAYGGLTNWYGVLYSQPKRAHSIFFTVVPADGWQWDTTAGYTVYEVASVGTLLSFGQMVYFKILENTRLGLGGDFYKTSSGTTLGGTLNLGQTL